MVHIRTMLSRQFGGKNNRQGQGSAYSVSANTHPSPKDPEPQTSSHVEFGGNNRPSSGGGTRPTSAGHSSGRRIFTDLSVFGTGTTHGGSGGRTGGRIQPHGPAYSTTGSSGSFTRHRVITGDGSSVKPKNRPNSAPTEHASPYAANQANGNVYHVEKRLQIVKRCRSRSLQHSSAVAAAFENITDNTTRQPSKAKEFDVTSTEPKQTTPSSASRSQTTKTTSQVPSVATSSIRVAAPPPPLRPAESPPDAHYPAFNTTALSTAQEGAMCVLLESMFNEQMGINV